MTTKRTPIEGVRLLLGLLKPSVLAAAKCFVFWWPGRNRSSIWVWMHRNSSEARKTQKAPLPVRRYKNGTKLHRDVPGRSPIHCTKSSVLPLMTMAAVLVVQAGIECFITNTRSPRRRACNSDHGGWGRRNLRPSLSNLDSLNEGADELPSGSPSSFCKWLEFR